VLASLDNPNYRATDATGTLVIKKAGQTIDFAKLANKTYGDAAFGVSATGGAPGNAVTFAAQGNCTIAGTTVTITGAGACTITASQAGNNNYEAAKNVAQSFDIAKAKATVTLSNLSHLYDGSPKAAAVQTVPANLNVVVTYQGSTTVPAAVGSYAVYAEINDANYQGSATATLTIAAWTPKGFYAPVDMTVPYATPVYNTTKGGNTNPLKFELFRGATESTNTADVKSLIQATVDCVSGGTSDEVEAVVSGSTALRYDSTSGMFIYNWKTPTTVACFKVTVTMADGSALHAYFQTRK